METIKKPSEKLANKVANRVVNESQGKMNKTSKKNEK